LLVKKVLSNCIRIEEIIMYDNAVVNSHKAIGLEHLRNHQYKDALCCLNATEIKLMNKVELDHYKAIALRGIMMEDDQSLESVLIDAEPAVLEILGQMLCFSGDSANACRIFRIAAERNHRSLPFHKAYGMALEMEQRYELATKQYTAAIMYEPDNASLWLAKLRNLVLAELLIEASVTAERYMRAHPENAEFLQHYFLILINARQFRAAEVELSKAKLDSKKLAYLKIKLALLQGHKEDALLLLLDQEKSPANQMLLAILMACIPSKYESAESLLLTLLKSELPFEHKQELMAYLLYARYQVKKYEEAYECCKALLDFSHKTQWFAFALFVQPLLLKRLHRHEQALDTLEDASVWLRRCDQADTTIILIIRALTEDLLGHLSQRDRLILAAERTTEGLQDVRLVKEALNGCNVENGFGMVADLIIPLWREKEWPTS